MCIRDSAERTDEGRRGKWWEKEATVAGEAMTEAQRRLCEAGNATGTQGWRERYKKSGATTGVWTGDCCSKPVDPAHKRTLSHLGRQELNAPLKGNGGGGMKFRCDVDFRLGLRGEMKPARPLVERVPEPYTHWRRDG